MKINKSNELKIRGKGLLPSLAQTFSKSPTSFVEGVYPVYAEKSNGAYIVDVDGNQYIDYLMSLGPVTLGYNYESVNQAIIKQLKSGIIFSLPHPLEIEAAELLHKVIPSADMVRYTKTGSDAVTGAVRGARAITKKDVILYCGGGGVWDDWFTILTNRNAGIPEFNKNLIRTFEFNNIESLQKLFEEFKDKVAAVIMEPVTLEEPKNNFLKKVQKITHENDSLLIFDEVLTGFRLATGGGQEFFNIVPDISTFAKGVANGMPLGAIVGKSEFMNIFEEVFVSTTFGGETLSLAACVATINEYETHDVCGHMWRLGQKFKDEFNKMCKEYEIDGECVGYPPRLKLVLRDESGEDSLLYKSFLLQDLIEKGIFMHPNVVLFSYSHTMRDIEYTLKELSQVMKKLKKSIIANDVKAQLRGNIAKQVIKMVTS